MANNTIRRSWNMYSMVNIEDLRGNAFQDEDGGHTFEITGLDASGNVAALSGTVAAVFLRADNTDVAIVGSVSGGKVYVTLTDECYGYPGRFGLTIFLTSGGQKVAIYAAIGSVHRTSSGAVSPETAQDVVDLINEIEAAIALIPSSYTDIMAAAAPTYSNTALYNVGSYAWYDGKLYCCITAITSGETWTSGHWTLANIGDDLARSKSSLDYLDEFVTYDDPLTMAIRETGRYFRTNGTIGSASDRSIIYFPCEVGKKYVIKCPENANSGATLGLAFGLSYNYDSALIDMQLIQNGTELAAVCPPSASGGFVIGQYSTSLASYVKFIQLNSEIARQETQINAIASEETNLLENATLYEKYLYPHYSTDRTSNNATSCFSPIPVRAGITYYFRRAWGNFSCIKYVNGDYISLSEETAITSGSVTPGQDGYAYITVEYGNNSKTALFTTSNAMYTKQQYVSRYVPNKLDVPKVYYVKKSGGGDFNKLSDAIIEATKYMDSVVYVGPGTWDLIDELGSEYIESVGINKRGLYLKNRIHLIFASNSKVTCNYAGSTASVMTWLSAFNAGEYGFTLENCRIEASKCRYAVHDERDTDSDAYTNKYINCSMYMNNSSNTQTTAHQCIGGGLGTNGHIVVENCDFESIHTGAVPSSSYTPVSYHNTAGTGKSRIDISGVFMVQGTVRLNSYGSSTDDTECFVHDCSFTHAIINEGEAGSTANNMNVTAWNNEIRGN